MGTTGDFSTRICVAPLLLVCGLTVAAQETPEPPLGLILTGNGAKILRDGSELPLNAKPGDILFSRDVLRSEGGTVTFLACSGNTEQTLSPDGDVVFDARGPKLRAGRVTGQKPAAGCFLPPVPRFVIASQQHADAAIAEELSSAAGPQTFDERLHELPEERRTQATAELAALNKAANPNDAVNHLARALVFEKYELDADAAMEMRQVVSAWPDAGWARSRLFQLVQGAARSRGVISNSPQVEGQTYAVLVGISRFKDERIRPLNFAHLDAMELSNLLKSPRAGAIPDDNVVVLTNEAATRSAIQSAIETNLKGRAGKNDTVLLFIASHGASFAVGNANKGYIVTYDSNPEELATSGIPMDDVRQLFASQLGNVKRLLLYVDVCHAGHIGQIESDAGNTNKAASALEPADVDMFGMLAAQKSQVAIEGLNYGGGHGAFTYFLMRALNGDADLNADGKVTMDELADYVKDKVQESTASRQIPKTIGDTDQARVMAQTTKPGIQLKDYTRLVLTASRGLTSPAPQDPSVPAVPSTASRLKYQDAATLVDQFEKAIVEGRILNTEDQGAFTFLAALKARLKRDDYQQEAEKLHVALEDRGQEVLLAYLAGDRVPQQRGDFVRGAAYFEAALQLVPDSLYLESRMTFCQGRVAIFDKDYARAAALLERAIGLDGERGYAFNGLGIAYLERANYDLAISAFRDASRRAPYWAYPLHNMALAYTEKGDYDNAIRVYQRAMRLAPRVAYLPYNLGLLYQRMNRRAEAQAMYQQALGIEAGNPQVLNALGSLKAVAGRRAEAEQFYKQALDRDPGLLAARHNLAVLLAADAKRSAEAFGLWRDNLARDPDHLPSRLSLARALAATGRNDEAAQEYEKVISARPDYVAARLALADADIRINKPEAAVGQLQQALRLTPDDPEILEQAARAYVSLGRNVEARFAYEKALEFAPDGTARKRLRGAISKLGN